MRSPYTEEFDPRSWWWDSCCAIFAEVGANNFVPFSPPALMSEGTPACLLDVVAAVTIASLPRSAITPAWSRLEPVPESVEGHSL